MELTNQELSLALEGLLVLREKQCRNRRGRRHMAGRRMADEQPLDRDKAIDDLINKLSAHSMQRTQVLPPKDNAQEFGEFLDKFVLDPEKLTASVKAFADPYLEGQKQRQNLRSRKSKITGRPK